VPGADAITVRQLLQHTSGLPDFDGLAAVTQPYLAGDLGFVWHPRALIDLAVAQPPLHAPGAGFAYSNTNYLVAGLLVEAVSHRPLGELLRRRIFRLFGAVAAVLGRLVFKERLAHVQLAGVAIIVAGVATLSLAGAS
jgi:D-alanyl-D-alanine carboxypeptidase